MAPVVSAAVTAAVASAMLVVPAHGNSFLGAHPKRTSHSLAQELVRQTLSSEFTLLSSERTLHLEEELRPLFSTLPKNEAGNLDGAAVRYALHRYFTKKHGWSVNGLDSQGQAWNASSVADVMTHQLPRFIQNLLEERVSGHHGLNLEELAVFAATLSDLIYNEARGDIEHIYSNLGLDYIDPNTRLTPELEKAVLDRFLVAYISGYHEENGNFEDMRKELEQQFFSWKDMEMFADDQRRTWETNRLKRNPFAQQLFTFESHVEIAQDFVQHFMTWQNTECNAWKQKLMEMEHQGSGRVRLNDFYSGRADPDWSFVESVEYLRAVGALDESLPGKPSVIIANYITSASNCLSPSEFYNVCCRDECEDLMAHVEARIGHPSGSPREIIDLVSGLASATVDAPRNMSMPQVARLEEIAAHHNGRVPLHGRLFAQWMHHAYPRECPFPHLSGTTAPKSHEEFNQLHKQVGFEAEATEAEMRRHSYSASNGWADQDDTDELVPWISDEELVTSHRHMMPTLDATRGSRSSLRTVMCVVGGLSALVALFRSFEGLKAATPFVADFGEKSHLV